MSQRPSIRTALQLSAMVVAFLAIMIASLGTIALKSADRIPAGVLNANHVVSQFEVVNDGSRDIAGLTSSDPALLQEAQQYGLRLVCLRTELRPGERTTCGPGYVPDRGVFAQIQDAIGSSTSARTWVITGIVGTAIAGLLMAASALPVFNARKVVIRSIRNADGTRTWGSS